MSISKYTSTVLPDRDTDDDVPLVLAGIWDNVDSRFVLRADSTADRNSKFADAPKNSVVVCAAEKAMWLKLYDTAADVPSGGSLWWTIGQDLGWVSNAVTEDPNGLWDVTSAWLCVRNGWVDFSMRLSYIGTAQIDLFNRFGDVVNSTVGSISTALSPMDFASLTAGHVGGGALFSVQSTGSIQLGSITTGGGATAASVQNGNSFTAQGSWALGVMSS